MPTQPPTLPPNYTDLLAALTERIHNAQMRAALSVNRELVLLYWQIGREIRDQQAEQGWGSKVIDRLAQDLREAFPEMKGFSPRNLKYMRAFAAAWPEEPFVQEVLAQIFVAIDLKIGEFQPEYAGKMNFYLSALDATLRGEQDQPSIGLILCRTRNRIVVEYALRDMSKPIGVSAYQLTQALPESLKGSLPTIDELEAELIGE